MSDPVEASNVCSAMGSLIIDKGFDETCMKMALEEAEQARRGGEVPVGAVLVKGDRIVAKNHNRCIELNDPTAHAEILVLREAGATLQNYRLEDTVIYVTAEPCSMCASAMIHGRISRLVFGTHEPKFGAVESKFRLLDGDDLNHKVQVEKGILAQACAEMLIEFFKSKR